MRFISERKEIMREIKFRAWDKDSKRWWTHEETLSLLLLQGRVLNGTADGKGKLERYVIEQYTGLKDKNGVDLDWWAGDLLNGVLDSPVSIVFSDGAFYFQSSKSPHRMLCSDYVDIDGIKVIGNIHTEPNHA